MENNIGIYCWRNRVNNKRYIGQSTDLKKRYGRFIRWRSTYGQMHTNKPVDIDRQAYPDLKYWEYTILEYCTTEQLTKRETYWIDYFNTNKSEHGYNLLRSGRTVTDDIKQRISVAQKDRPLTEEHRKALGRPVRQYAKDGTFIRLWDNAETARQALGVEHIGSACKGRIQSAGGFLWRYASDESIPEKYNPKTTAKPILQCTADGEVIREWISAREASRTLGIPDAPLTAVCRGRLKSYKGYVWKYKNENNRKPANKLKTYSVVQMSLDGEFMAYYPSLRQAHKSSGAAVTNIKRACLGIYQTAGGYKWRFATPEENPTP